MFGLLRRYFPIALLHLYVAARLVPDVLPAGALAVAALCAWLAASATLIPLSFMARRSTMRDVKSRVLAWTGLIAMGMFSSLFVLTLLRDVALLGGFTLSLFAHVEGPLNTFRHSSALAVPLLAALLTAVGFVNARRRAGVREVEVPIENLPAALNGFTIAQISDVHVGPRSRAGTSMPSSMRSTPSTPTWWRSPAISSTARWPSSPRTPQRSRA
jgi:hypothetical protein